jgi:methionyl-tRNA formyltransferase
MLEHILLVSDEVERSFLTETLRAASADIDIRHVSDPTGLAKIETAILPHARLVTFSVESAIPPGVLSALGHGAYNFHPGSPAYPGWMPAAFAIYDGAKEFGATAHSISGQDGNGGIVGVDTFAVPEGASRADLARAAYLAMLGLVQRLAKALVTIPAPLPTLPMVWGSRRGTRALFADLCDFRPDIDAEELQRRIRAFGGGDGLSVPTVWLHGVQFRHSSVSSETQG